MESKLGRHGARVTVCEAMADISVAGVMENMIKASHQIFLQAVNTAYLAVQVAEAHGYQGSVITLAKAALLHDAGMITVPKLILDKHANLTGEEHGIVEMHAKRGGDMLKSLGFDDIISGVASSHHERLDGSGYPLRLTDDKISLESGIVAVCDVYEALTTPRPYRNAFNMYEALSLMESMPLNKSVLLSVRGCTDC